MAIEVNKRKRKHKSVETVTNGDSGAPPQSPVPKKIAKKSKSPKKEKKKQQTLNGKHAELEEEEQQQQALEPLNGEQALEPLNGEQALEPLNGEQAEPFEADEDVDNGHNDDGRDDEAELEEQKALGLVSEEKPLKFSNDFKMLNFRAKLRGTNFITELRHFLHLIQTSRPKLVAKYIEKRGKPLELAEALERVDKSNVLHIAYLCQALQLVVMEILTNQKGHMESAEHACRYFLKTHGAVVELLLKSVQLQHRRTALKLLTAIVCVEPQLGRQLLSSYDMLSNVKHIEDFLSHSKFEVGQEETVRKCFIHFVLAYLIDGNTLLIRNILDRGTLLRALASGLQYDDHVTVCVVLSTLRKYVLECADISKTKKIHVFDLECCKHFARLYDWLGPHVFAAKFVRKNDGTPKLKHSEDELIYANERDAVGAAVHEFLLVLLTSRKHGITFDSITHFRQKHNALQGKIMGFLYKPWIDERKTDLIIKIVTTCPELARNSLRHFSGIVNPMRTPQRDWSGAVEFLIKLITALHPKVLSSALDKITLTDYAYWIKDICLPIETLVLMSASKVLRNANFENRLAANRLILAMFTQYSNYMTAIAKREQVKGGNSLRRFRFDILNHIMMHFPTMEEIIYSLYLSIQMQDSQNTLDVLQHLEVTLDLVLIICKENRSFVNKTNTILEYLDMLRPLYAGDKEDSAEVSTVTSNRGNIKLELKAIKTILTLFPNALKPCQTLFPGVLVSFVKAFVRGAAEVQREAGLLLRGIFKNTGIFDGGELEIDLWLESLHFFDVQTVDVVTQVFLQVLQVTKADVDAPKSDETITNEKNLHRLFDNIEKGFSVQAFVETLAISKLMPLIYKGVEIAKPLSNYLETVCLLMYHYYPTPEYVLKLYEMEFKSQTKYMRSWLPNATEETHLAGVHHERVPHLKAVQLAILEGTSTFEGIFAKTDSNFEIEFNGKLTKFDEILQNERIVLIYAQQALFVVAQLVEKQRLERAQAERAAAFLINCLAIVRKMEETTLAENSLNLAGIAEDSSFLRQMLAYIFSVRISYIRSAELFTTTDASHLNYLHFLRELTEYCNVLPGFDTYAANYRLKIVKAVAISLQSIEASKQQSEKLNDSLKLIKAFNLNAENCLEILELLATQLKYSDLYLQNTQQKSVYYELLTCTLQRLSALQKAVRCDLFMRKFVKFYTQLVRKFADFNLESLEEAFYDFLLISHQYIPQLDLKFFGSIFVERKLTKSTIKLACLLLERDAKLHAEFLSLLPEHIDKKELIYPLLKIAFDQQLRIESTLLQRIYQSYKNGFMRTIEKPQKAGVIYKENVEASIALIEQCMPRSECVDFCNKGLKFDVIEDFQVRIIHAIYQKAMSTLETDAIKQKSNVFVNFINLQIQMLAVDLKKSILDLEKLQLFAHFLQQWWQQSHASEIAHDFSKILKSQQWLNFCKTCLKLGMHINDSAVVDAQQTDALHGLLLKLLAFLCDRLYADYDENSASNSQEPAQLYDMICTHSKFYDIVLAQRAAPSLVKTELLHLLYTLAVKSPAVLNDTQITVLLGAYQAKLSDADRWTLALLQLCEMHQIDLSAYRPFIWGESAIAFYALRAADEERAKLAQQETSVAQVMSLIDRQLCDYTIDNFPIWRKLNGVQQLPTVEFVNPFQKSLSFGSNHLEKRIELGHTEFVESDLRLCPKRDTIYTQCYDPAFFVPLMSMCFAPESYAHPVRPVQNGLLSLVFAALSSQDRDLRLAAGVVQLRYRAHFEHSKFFERPLWIQAYENIQTGLADLRDSWMKHKRNSGTPRVPFISGLFVAKTFNLTTEPTHLLYKQLTMYLRLKSSFNFQCVPEFNVLFYSPEVEHHAFRQFIVEVIRNGVKSSSDLFLLVSTNTFKVLMGFYGSTMSTLDLNLLILSVFSTCVKIPASTKIMIEHVGILPWLSSILSGVEFYHFDIIEGLISILNNLWYALKANAAEFHNFAHISLALHRLVLQLLPHLSARIAPSNFAKLLNILQKTATTQHAVVSAVQLDHLIECAQKHFATHVHSIEAVRAFGGAGAASHKAYCEQLHRQQVEPTAILALSSLRSYTIDWWQCHHGSEAAVAADAVALNASLLNASVD